MEIEVPLVPCAALCPGCGARMIQLSLAQGVAAGCRACGGVWIDHLISRLAVTGGLSDAVKAFLRHVAEGATGAAPAGYRDAAHRGERQCPVCREALVQRDFGERPTILDFCGLHGAYFDLRELDGIVFDVEMKDAVANAEMHVAATERAHQRHERVFGLVNRSAIALGRRL